MTRRKILLLITGGIVVVTGAIVSVFTLPRLLLSALRRSQPQFMDLPTSVFRLGKPSEFAIGVDSRFLETRRVWVVRNTDRLFVVYGSCTHQGCTPDWVAQENKFKCPCHESHFCIGSAFDGQGINCGGPAPRPLDRVRIKLDSDGQVIADTSKLYKWTKAERSQFDEAGAYVPVTRD